jgi:hypothetical protein
MKREDLITALIAIVVLYALYKISQLLKGVGDNVGAPADATTGGSEKDEPQTSNLSYPLWKYKQLADGIESAIWDGLGFTEDDDQVENILKQCSNDDDFLALSNAYGVRGRGLILRDYYNLITTIGNYVDNINRQRVNEYFASKGMTTRVP